ncbi:efflux transporter outer membrane subunit [Pseudomonas sp. ABC1]|uniref:efflux transporter outer membrane subunit n=1 Tax=Pseudomonas sp. ABC1 TaxID=2748080 RepID=UPI0015C2D872|nr:efflux transporter outer membrane subunit [Pseudomonas sp. ABC1]QLF93463.1 efflux transporter outer membrane subunit [Pseudomonas sp. ABC1]
MNVHSMQRALAPLAAALLLAGCSLAPHYQRPDAPIPAQWQTAGQAADSASTASTLDWQAFVSDAQLRGLVEQALASNRSLRQTLLDVEAARAQYRVQRADRLPGLEAQGNGSRQRVPGDLSSSGRSEVQSSYQAGLGLTAFELDLFGRVRNLSEAALEEYLATEEAARAAQISLVAEVIQAYLSRDGAKRRHDLTEQTLQAREASLELIAQRRRAGTASALDYEEARGLVGQARAALERTEREFRQAGNALELLVGNGQPLPAAAPLGTVLVQEIAAGTPSELLANRPDIRAAEHRLKARNASIGAARATFFPRISLTGLFGSSSAELSDLFSGGQRAWSFAPQITLPLFDGGRNRSSLDLAQVRRDSAVAAYEGSVQEAFREVADALAQTDTLRREADALRTQAQSSQQALRLSRARYRAGVDDHLRYLDAQRSDFTSQTELIEVETQRQIALATLFKALGGGWPATERQTSSR